jgi:hypothetical protein
MFMRLQEDLYGQVVPAFFEGLASCQILLTELTVLTLEVNTNGIELILQYRIVAGLEMLSDFEFSFCGGALASY